MEVLRPKTLNGYERMKVKGVKITTRVYCKNTTEFIHCFIKTSNEQMVFVRSRFMNLNEIEKRMKPIRKRSNMEWFTIFYSVVYACSNITDKHTVYTTQ